MSFVASRSFVVLGAVTNNYILEHIQLIDANNNSSVTRNLRSLHIEVTNMTNNVIFIAWDRVVTPPSGNGVQGPLNVAQYPISGPIAATPGDFDLAVTSGTGWGAIDAAVPYNSKFMSVYTVAAGNVIVSYGNQL